MLEIQEGIRRDGSGGQARNGTEHTVSETEEKVWGKEG